MFGRDRAPSTRRVGQAVEASCAIPGYFSPATIGGRRYVDGGVHSTTNADLAAEFDPLPDLVLLSAPMSAVSKALPRSQAFTVRQLARRQVATEVATLRAKGVTVVTFQPTAADLAVMTGNSMDSGKAVAVCDRVRQSIHAHLREPTVAERLTVLGNGPSATVGRGRLTATTMGGGRR